MNKAQRLLIEKTLKRMGFALLAIFALCLTWGLARVVILKVLTWDYFFRGLFDVDDAALILWPMFVSGLACLWISSYLAAGRATD